MPHNIVLVVTMTQSLLKTSSTLLLLIHRFATFYLKYVLAVTIGFGLDQPATRDFGQAEISIWGSPKPEISGHLPENVGAIFSFRAVCPKFRVSGSPKPEISGHLPENVGAIFSFRADCPKFRSRAART